VQIIVELVSIPIWDGMVTLICEFCSIIFGGLKEIKYEVVAPSPESMGKAAASVIVAASELVKVNPVVLWLTLLFWLFVRMNI
jgi:hypothetical protein